MIRGTTISFAVLLALLPQGACTRAEPRADLLAEPPGLLADTMTVVDVPARRVLRVTATGSYDQHADVIRGLCDAGKACGQPADDVFYTGIYPDDPRTTPEDELTWTIVMPIDDAELDPDPPYEVATLPACRAMVYEAANDELPTKSHRADELIGEMGLAQSAPTRMVILGTDDAGRQVFRVLKPVGPAP